MLDLDGLDGVRAEETAPRPMAPRPMAPSHAERVRVITPPPLPDGAPPGAEAAPPEDDAATVVASLRPRTPHALWAIPLAICAVVAVAWLVTLRTRSARVVEPTPRPASRPIVTPLPPPPPIDAILPARFGFNERTPHGDAHEIAAVVARCGRGEVVLTGHADALGSARANDEIAAARAEAVRDLLVAEGLDATRVRMVSAGATQPIASNASARGRRDNRRVSLHCEPHNGGEP